MYFDTALHKKVLQEEHLPPLSLPSAHCGDEHTNFRSLMRGEGGLSSSAAAAESCVGTDVGLKEGVHVLLQPRDEELSIQ